jgi:hypothetical protein
MIAGLSVLVVSAARSSGCDTERTTVRLPRKTVVAGAGVGAIIGLGVALQHLSPGVTLLIFGLAVGLGVVAAAPILARPAAKAPKAPEPDTDPMPALYRCHGAPAR